MNIDIDLNKLSMEELKTIRIGKRMIAFLLIIQQKKFKGEEIYGWANNAADKQYVTFIDYDIQKSADNIKSIVRELREIQKLYLLSEFYLFSTENGYHAINIDKISLSKFQDILDMTTCDRQFFDVPVRFGHMQWVLRLSAKDSKKPEHFLTLASKYHQHEQSLAHRNVLQNFYKLKISDKHCDNNNAFIGAHYPV